MTDNEVLRFFFEDTDGCGSDVDVFALVKYPKSVDERNKLTNKITDAISSYLDTVEDWQFEELVSDVLNSFGLEYQIIEPTTFCI